MSQGLFETMLVAGGAIILEREHRERMAEAARRIGAPALELDVWEEAAREALRARRVDGQCGLRCIYQRDDRGVWVLSAVTFDLPEITLRRRVRGRVTILPPSIQRQSPEVKSVEWLLEIRLLRATLLQDVDEGLLVGEGGGILEGTSTNVFAIDDDVLLTPPLEAGILPGTVREWVIRNAPRVGFSVRYGLLDREDLVNGSFLTSSLSLLSRIRDVDGEQARDPGARYRELAERLDTEMAGNFG